MRDKDFMKIHGKIRSNIKEHGFSIINVMGTEKKPPFTYTIGIWKTYKSPELVIYGVPGDIAKGMMWNVIRKIKKGETIQPNKRYQEIVEGYDCIFINVTKKRPDGPFSVTTSYYMDVLKEKKFKAMQLVWPDTKGIFPWEKGFDKKFDKMQPLLGTFKYTN